MGVCVCVCGGGQNILHNANRWGGGGFQVPVSPTCNWWEIEMWLLFDSDRKSYMRSPMVPLGLTWVALKGQILGHPGLEALYLVKEFS